MKNNAIFFEEYHCFIGYTYDDYSFLSKSEVEPYFRGLGIVRLSNSVWCVLFFNTLYYINSLFQDEDRSRTKGELSTIFLESHIGSICYPVDATKRPFCGTGLLKKM